MTKTEAKKAINKAVYIYAESLGYNVIDDGMGASVTFDKQGDRWDNTIDYHRSSHTTCTLNWATDDCKEDADKIEAYAQEQINKYSVVGA